MLCLYIIIKSKQAACPNDSLCYRIIKNITVIDTESREMGNNYYIILYSI